MFKTFFTSLLQITFSTTDGFVGSVCMSWQTRIRDTDFFFVFLFFVYVHF